MNTAKVLLVLALLLVALVAGCNDGYASSDHAVRWRQTGAGWYVPDSVLQP